MVTTDHARPMADYRATRRVIVAISGASGAVYGVRLLKALRDIKGVESHLVVSDAGWRNLQLEGDLDRAALEALADQVHDVHNVGAAIASGSFQCSGMIVAPCSMRTLAAVANGLADNLITRSADVTLKERRRLAACRTFGGIGCNSTAVLHFWLRRSSRTPSFCPIVALWGCKSGKNWPRWGRISLRCRKSARLLVLMVRESPLHLAHLRNMISVTEMGGIICPPLPAFYLRPQSVSDIVDYSVARVLDLLDLSNKLAPRWDGLAPPEIAQ